MCFNHKKYADVLKQASAYSTVVLLSSDSDVGRFAVPLIIDGHGHTLVVVVE